MSIRRHWLPAILLGSLFATPAWGQRNQETEQLRGKGTLKGVRSGVLYVEMEDAEKWYIRLPNKPQDVSFRASAKPDWLQARMLVRFNATFDGRGKPVDAVRDVEVFTPRGEGDELGVTKDGNIFRGLKLFSNDNDQGGSETQATTYRIAGRLTGFKNGQLTVNTGRTRVQVPLDEKAKVSIDISDYRFAREGDTVDVEAMYYPNQKGLAIARKVTITAKEPLVSAAEERRRRAEAKKKKKDDGDQDQ